jgi:beta-lactamase class A
MRRRTRLKLEHILLLILLGMAALTVTQYVSYRQRFPRPLQVGGLILQGMGEEDIHQRLQEAFAQPVMLRYVDQEVELDPDEVGFRLHVEQMLHEAWDQPSVQLEAADFLAVTLGGADRPLPVPLVADYDPQALRGKLQTVAAEWDRPAQLPRLLKARLRFAPGEPECQLDVEASLPHVVSALLSSTERVVDLTILQEDGDPFQRDLGVLRAGLPELVSDFPGVVGVFVKDLATGEELGMNEEVAFAGMSLMKVGIVEEFYRHTDRAPTREETKLLTETMTVVGNYTSNLLLAEVGEGNSYEGARRLTESMRRIGLANTFMAAPYDSAHGRPPPHVVTSANSRSDVDTEPDPYMQTTPQEIGLLLEMIYQGAEGGGTLIAAYPGQITPEECRAVLELMKSNRIGTLLEEGVPAGIPLAHKHGWISDTHADAGIVFSPAGDYVVVVFVHQQGWLEWQQSAPLVADIGHVIYNYYNMDDQW